MTDTIEIVIAPDGKVTITTGDCGGPLHTTIEEMLRVIQRELGATTQVTQRPRHRHHHRHERITHDA